MLNPHTSAAIAQVVFYAPILPVTVFILVKNWNNRPRMAWYPLVTFSLFRLSGGIIAIVRSSKPYDIGLIIATTILLNVGMIPLLIALIGITRIPLKASADSNRLAKIFLKVVRIGFIAAISLLIASGALSGSESTLEIARDLARAAYVVLAAILALTTLELIHLVTQKSRIAPQGYYYVKYCLFAVPFLAIRTAAGLLYEFTIQNPGSLWNPLSGLAVAFVFMTLLPEYIMLLIFIYLGFHRMHDRVEKIEEGIDAQAIMPQPV